MASNTVHFGDCMQRMQSLPDNHYDLAIVDPPYFAGPNTRQYYGASVRCTAVKRVSYPILPAWQVPGAEYFEELQRISKEQIVWGCNYYDYQFGPGRIVWDKCNGNSSFSDCELAACSMFDSVRLFRFMWNGMMQGLSITHGHVQQGDKRKNEKRIHPTQKPVALYLWLLDRYAQPGFKIYDSHTGSGSLRIACDMRELEFEGDEIDPEMYRLQEHRYQQHKSALTLF